jgi:hypothetical protein
VKKAQCKTPGARYHIKIGPHVVECRVDIPHDLCLDKEAAIQLENKVHDALEGVLAKYWDRPNPWEGFDKLPPGF